MSCASRTTAGIDIGNDGEQQRVGFQTYVPQRMSGFGGESKRRRGREFEEFPELIEVPEHRFPNVVETAERAGGARRDPLSRHQPLQNEIARFKRIAAEDNGFTEMFMTAPSPGIIAIDHAQRLLRQPRFLSRCARARDAATNIRRSTKPGLILQIDAPDLAMDRTHDFQDLSDAEFAEACARSRSPRSTRGSRAFRAIACGCMSATAIGKARISTTSRWNRSCRRFTRRMSARCRSNSPIRAMRMNMRRSRNIRCPRTCCCCPA